MKKPANKFDCIYVNGCSWAYGSELTDPGSPRITNHFDPVHERYREQNNWPTRLATAFGVPVHNNSMPGGSNDRILRTGMLDIIQLIKQGARPFVVIAWSQLHRFELPDSNNNYGWRPFVSPKDPNNLEIARKIWAEHSSDRSDIERWLVQIISLDGFLKSHDLNYVSTTVFNSTYPIFERVTEEKYFDPYLHYLKTQMNLDHHLLHYSLETYLRQQAGIDYGPGGHPLVSGHELISNHLRRHMLNTFQFQRQ